jgi:hypothetical protein
LSSIGKALSKRLQNDSLACLTSLLSFETLSKDEIRGFLAKYRANIITLSSMKESSNVDEIQSLLDKAVKEE